jgi:hypothetical protein
MNRLVLAGIASIVAVVVVAFALAAASDDDDDSAVSPTATATVPAALPTAQPTSVPATVQPGPRPTQGPDTPVSSTPGGLQPAPTWTAIPLPRHPEPAPIDGLDVLTLESFPPQYMLHVKAGLPSGCAEPLSHRVVGRQGNVVQVEVLNSIPDNAICTAIYGMYELNINLGSDFTSGVTYTVRVNDKEVTFSAQ